jgi:hypothetical protein
MFEKERSQAAQQTQHQEIQGKKKEKILNRLYSTCSRISLLNS